MPEYTRPGEFRFPDSLATLYPQNPHGPWHLEVGFGDGRFWAAQAALEEGANYLGVEISGVSVQKALARYRALGLEQVRVARLAAEFVVRNVVPPASLTRVYVNFPDPWPKARHEEARLLRPGFLELLSTRLVDGGELWLTTDHPEYFQFALESAAATGLYGVTQPEPPDAALHTKYALKWRSQGLPVFHARFRPTARSPEAFPPLERSETMPHAILRGPLPTEALPKIVERTGDGTVILLESYARPDRLVVLARVEERDFIQEVLLSASKRDNEEVVVGLESFGSPLITPGVKAAVGVLTDRLSHSLEVVKRSY